MADGGDNTVWLMVVIIQCPSTLYIILLRFTVRRKDRSCYEMSNVCCLSMFFFSFINYCINRDGDRKP